MAFFERARQREQERGDAVARSLEATRQQLRQAEAEGSRLERELQFTRACNAEQAPEQRNLIGLEMQQEVVKLKLDGASAHLAHLQRTKATDREFMKATIELARLKGEPVPVEQAGDTAEMQRTGAERTELQRQYDELADKIGAIRARMNARAQELRREFGLAEGGLTESRT